jgi:hypothetical protein
MECWRNEKKPKQRIPEISDHQQNWGYEDGPWKGPGPPLLVAADFLIVRNTSIFQIFLLAH